MHETFNRFAKLASDAAGSPWAFVISVVILVVWALLGPVFRFSDTWQLTINTAASIVPTIMVFLIQNTQNREARALHLKLDEILRHSEGTQSPFINLEALSDGEIDRLVRHLAWDAPRSDTESGSRPDQDRS
jgi:low affinity Fe/Cu permease